MRKNPKQFVDLECEFCAESIHRAKKEHTRNQKIGRRVFCNNTCCLKWQLEKHPEKMLNKNIAFFKTHNYGRKTDELSPFRYILRRIKVKKFGKSMLTPGYLRTLWLSQNGKCSYTGLTLLLPKNICSKKVCHLAQASLDRIDSAKGYIEGNVEFVALGINYAKNGFSKDEMLHFIDTIRKTV